MAVNSQSREETAHATLLTVQLEADSPSPETGYVAAKKLLATKLPFTALFAFNDMSAWGAIRAFHKAGLCVPEDISVIGFDDIYDAAFNHPSLTTVWASSRRKRCCNASTTAQMRRIRNSFPSNPN